MCSDLENFKLVTRILPMFFFFFLFKLASRFVCHHIFSFTFRWILSGLSILPPHLPHILSIHHPFSPSLGKRAGISLETACHTAHSQHQTVPMHSHHSPPLPAACSQLTTLQFTSNQRAVLPFSSSSFPSWLSPACVFQGQDVLPIQKDVFSFLFSMFMYSPPSVSKIECGAFISCEKKGKYRSKESCMDGSMDKWTEEGMDVWINTCLICDQCRAGNVKGQRRTRTSKHGERCGETQGKDSGWVRSGSTCSTNRVQHGTKLLGHWEIHPTAHSVLPLN